MPDDIQPQGFIEQLLEMIEDGLLPLDWWQQDGLRDLRTYRALRYGIKPDLVAAHPNWKSGRPYKYDPLPKRMSLAFADFQFGEPIVSKPANETDLVAHKDLLRECNLTSQLRKGADICATEGKVWWNIYTDARVSPWPQISFRSRTEALPWMSGDRVIAVALVTTYYPISEDKPTYRLLECHEDGRVLNVLYRAEGRTTQSEQTPSTTSFDPANPVSGIGEKILLTDYTQTADYEEEWEHGLPMLAGYVPNEDEAASIFDGLVDLLLDLNEAHTVDSENFRLAGKKRAVMDKKYQDQAGDADAGEEIFWAEDDSGELDTEKVPLKVLEYQYDADGSIKRKDDLERIVLTRVGLARQLVDANANEGLAQTGTALRTRLLPTIQAIKGKTKEWVERLPTIITLLQRVDALPEQSHGGGHQWSDSETVPSIEIASPLPVDAQEEASRHSTLMSAEIEALETAIEEMRPTWSRERRELEIRRILANKRGYALDDDGKPIVLESVPRTDRSSEEGGVTEGIGGPPEPPEGEGVISPSRPGQTGAGVGAGLQ